MREYIDENAPENNGIPTVDPDLTSNTYYHYNTLPTLYDKSLTNSGLRTLDYVLSNMGKCEVFYLLGMSIEFRPGPRVYSI